MGRFESSNTVIRAISVARSALASLDCIRAAIDVTVGSYHLLALMEDGTAWAPGRTDEGRLAHARWDRYLELLAELEQS